MIPPYQAATEEVRKQSQTPTNLLKTAGAIGTSLVGGSAIASRILPLINKFVPADLMRKGLSKVDPRVGGFVETAINNGFSLDDVRNFMTEKFSQGSKEQKQANPLQDFETSYPDIAQALSGYINQGQSPDAAAGILKTSTAFGKKIGKLEKETGKNFVDYVLELFGNGQQSQMQQPSPQQMQPQNQQMQQAQQAPQGQGLDPQLMQLMNGIRSSIQNLRGGNG